MKALLHRTILVGIFIAAVSVPCLACWCRESNTKANFEQADVVFTGRVVNVYRSYPSEKTLFDVTESAKGSAHSQIEIDGSLCDVHLIPGMNYVVYAEELEGRLWALSCGGTRELDVPVNTLEIGCDVTELRPSFAETAIVTAICVSLSLSIGYLVSSLRKRKK
jgi:hypothetical protein